MPQNAAHKISILKIEGAVLHILQNRESAIFTELLRSLEFMRVQYIFQVDLQLKVLES